MRSILLAIGVCFTLSFAGCVSRGPGGKYWYGIEGTPCSETYKQADKNYELVLELANKAEATGKITSQKLMEIRDDAANYRAQSRDLCNFFRDDKITFDQYTKAMEQNNQHYRGLVQNIPHT